MGGCTRRELPTHRSGVVILKHGSETNGEAARKFYEFIQSVMARAIFAKNGYKLP